MEKKCPQCDSNLEVFQALDQLDSPGVRPPAEKGDRSERVLVLQDKRFSPLILGGVCLVLLNGVALLLALSTLTSIQHQTTADVAASLKVETALLREDLQNTLLKVRGDLLEAQKRDLSLEAQVTRFESSVKSDLEEKIMQLYKLTKSLEHRMSQLPRK